LGELLHEPLFVPRTTPVKRLFLTFKQKKVHMAIVVSEYGKVLGLVTMDDLLAQIFGRLRDERTVLQDTIPPSRGLRAPAARTDSGTGPMGAPGAAGGARDGRDRDGSDADPAVRGVREPAAPTPTDDERSGPVIQPEPPDAANPVLDPPPRPIHDVDEVTPP